jgi:hypothetical protein
MERFLKWLKLKEEETLKKLRVGAAHAPHAQGRALNCSGLKQRMA